MGCGASSQKYEPAQNSIAVPKGTLLTLGEELTVITKPIRNFYTLDSKLGKGSFGVVTKGIHKETKKVRAVKQIRKAGAQLETFAEELQVQSSLDHPGVVKLFEVYEDASYHYLVMELCTGKELFDAIVDHENKKFSERQASMITLQILRAVNYLHNVGVCHRDIKAENFLLAKPAPLEEAVIKIVDFGLATRFKKGQILTLCAGSPIYVAPEVLKRAYNEKVDVWSCGVLLFIMLSGGPPFFGSTNDETLNLIRKGNVQFKGRTWKHISEGAVELIKKMLCYEAKNRLSADEALQHAWIKDRAPNATDAPLDASFLDNLRGFCGQNKLKKAALHTIARRLTDEEIQTLKDAFVALDKNKDGVVTYQELREGLEKLGGAAAEVVPELKRIVSELDCNETMSIDYTEFLAATLDESVYMHDSVLWSAFCVYDKNGDGRICRKELQQVLAEGEVGELVGAEMVESVMKECDADADGVISFDEFKAMMKRGAAEAPKAALNTDEAAKAAEAPTVEEPAAEAPAAEAPAAEAPPTETPAAETPAAEVPAAEAPAAEEPAAEAPAPEASS